MKTVGVVLGAAALVAGTIATGGALGIVGAGLASTASTVSTVAGIAAGIANIGSQALAKAPPARGSVSQVLIMPDAPRPYPMGEGHFAGVQRHREGYGGTVDGVENPYWLEINVYSGVGPVQSITPQVDFAAVPAWYTGYLATDTQLGAMPEASALAATYGTPARWTAAHKLSGHAAIAWNYKFDKKGKKFASGLPLTGAYGEWNTAYDPRLDSTFPGGSGSHRVDDETTWEWTENPALHAGTYAYGRYAEGVKVMGIGLPVEGIDFATIAAWANVCEANDWTIFGVAFEGGSGDQQGVRWANLKDICAAGGGEPCFAGAVLSFRYDAPAISLDTVTDADVFRGMSVTFMQSWRDRLNTIVPKFRSPDHNWEIVAAEAVQEASYVSEDGEVRREEWPFNFVKVADQAAQLAAYRLVNSRELHPIRFTAMPRLRNYRPGDCLHLTLPRLGLDTDAILLERGPLDPRTMTRELVFIGETAAKHAYALGLTGTAPPTPALGQTAQERDETAAGAADRQVAIELVAYKSFPADYTGAIAAELFPAAIVPSVTLGGQDIRTEDSVSYSITSSGVTASVNDTGGDPDKGTIEITAVDTLDGWIDLTVEISGVTYPAKRIVVQKISGLAPGFGGSGSKIASDNSFTSISGTGFTAITDVMTVTLAGGERLYGTAPLSYWVDSGSPVSRTATAKWQYSPTGAGTWTDFDTAISGSAATGGFASEAGYGEFTHDDGGGLTAGDYDVRLMAQLDASGVSVTFAGTATIEAKV